MADLRRRVAINTVWLVFSFTEKAKIADVPENGELVCWMQEKQMRFEKFGLAGTKEFGLIEEYEKLKGSRCRPFNKIIVDGDVFIKEPVDAQGKSCLSGSVHGMKRQKEKGIEILPQIYGTNPLKMEYINGRNIYECNLFL